MDTWHGILLVRSRRGSCSRGSGFFKGTSADQDRRFSDKELKLLKTMKFPQNFDKKVRSWCYVTVRGGVMTRFLIVGRHEESKPPGHQTLDREKGYRASGFR